MPRKIEKEKQDYVPLDENDLKHALEVPVKNIDEASLIKVEKQGKMEKPIRKKTGLKTRNFSKDTGKIDSKLEGYALIITEKPQAAEKIANALGNPRKLNLNGVAYYTLERDKKKIVVAPAVGHLFNLTSKEKGWPVFDIFWEPSYEKNEWVRKYYKLLEKLVKNASEFINACDYDVEGEVIGWNIIRFIAKQKDAKRMKFSTLTSDELNQTYENLMPSINWGQAIAGETRHKLDWIYGINLSRALMEAIKKAGKFRIMSVGRVQGPALHLIVEKELEIEKFKPEAYWQIFIKLKNHEVELKYEKDIYKKQGIEKFKKLEGKKGQAKTEKSERRISPGFPFDLTSLQREAYRLFNINPAKTLQIAQNLYLQGLISYPRTSSQKIPEAINPKAILKKLNPAYTKFVTREKPVEGGKSDPAHPSIFPTGEYKRLSGEEEKIYNIIVKRFVSCFCGDAEIEDKRIIFICEDKKFKASGLEIKEKGWMNVYPLMMQEKEVEDINGEKEIEKSRIEEKMTQPPRRYTPASIITELERKNLGTKATRANIIETLYSRNYIKEQSIQATPLGISLIKTLERYSPIIIDDKLTRDFEKDMVEIERAKKNLEEKEEEILKKAKSSITKIAKDFKKHEEKIGKELVQATEQNYKQEKEENTLNECPVCKKGNLRILFNKKFRRSFVACNNYPECRTTFSLPSGLIKPSDKTCEKCGWPKLVAIKKGKKPWEFCFNPGCETNKKWQKKREENSENQ